MIKRLPIWPLTVLLFFAVIYFQSLTFVYIEGDDAVSIAYHVLGRNPDLQGPYSPYHALMDVILRILPAHEPTLRITSMTLTSIAGVMVILLMLWLVFQQLGYPEDQRLFATLFVLLAAPEFYYLSIVYQPTMIGMAFILASHLSLRHSLIPRRSQTQQQCLWGLSIVLFIVGAAMRWDLIVYGAVIAVDSFLRTGNLSQTRVSTTMFRRGVYTVIWGVLALLGWFVLLYMIGYPPNSIFGLNSTIREWWDAPSFAFFLRSQTLFTPAFVFAGIVGLLYLVRRRSLALVVAFAGICVTSIWLPRGMPKFFLAGIPGMLLIVLAGLAQLVQLRPRIPVYGILVILLFLPWVIGIQITYPYSELGPGFEVQDYAEVLNTTPQNRQSSIEARWFGGGTALPTYEGLRPIWGNYQVLLGGGWRRLYQDAHNEVDNIIEFARDGDYKILTVTERNGITNRLLSLGWVLESVEPFDATCDAYDTWQLTYTYAPDGVVLDQITLYDIYHDCIFEPMFMAEYASQMTQPQQVVYMLGVPLHLRVIDTSPNAYVNSIGKGTALINVNELARALNKDS